MTAPSATAFPSTAIREFATAVRAALSDLPVDEIDDLTDGLEADLTEQANDTGVKELGDPRAYADELRAAAGLPPREEDPPAASRPRQLVAVWKDSIDDFVAEMRKNPGTSSALDFAIALRPLWWVARGWLGYSYLAWAGIIQPAGNTGAYGFFAIVPSTLLGWAITLALVVLSVQWGRGRWMPWPWLRWARVTASILAVLAIPGFVAAMGTGLGVNTYPDVESEPSQGLILNGSAVSNIFAYDANGNPLTDVRLFDQNGLPLTTSGDDSLSFTYASGSSGELNALVPGATYAGDSGWNIYPLRQIPQDTADLYDQYSSLPATVEPTASLPPMFTIAPLPTDTSATPGSTTTPSVAPPTPTPSSTPRR